MKRAERRATRGREASRALVVEWKAGGQTAKAFADARDLSVPRLFYWSSVMRREPSSPRAAAKLLPVRVTPFLVAAQAAELEHSVKYAEAAIIQSGHSINDVRLVDPEFEVFDRLIKFYERRDPSLIARHDVWLKQYGVERDDVVMMQYDIVIDIASVVE